MRVNAGRKESEIYNEQKIISKYEGLIKRCAEVYFTSTGLLLFNCTLCENEDLTDVKKLCEHLTNEHQNVFSDKIPDESEETLLTQDDSNESSQFNDADCSNIILDEDEHSQQEDEEHNIDDLLSIVEYTITPVEEEMLDRTASDDNIIETQEQSNDELADVTEIEIKKPRARAGRRIRDNGVERRFKCTICTLAFKEAYNLRQHLRRHSQAVRFKCPQCSKKFHTRTELNTHFRRHTGETPFMCAECGRQFVTSGALSQHMKRHLNLRPCECDICGKRFFDTSQLKHHHIVHTRERTHACTTCNATFSRRKALVTHMKIHANKREYVCHICKTGFNQAPGLRVHLRSKHKDVLAIQEMIKKNTKSNT